MYIGTVHTVRFSTVEVAYCTGLPPMCVSDAGECCCDKNAMATVECYW